MTRKRPVNTTFQFLNGILYFLINIITVDAKTFPKRYLRVYVAQFNVEIKNVKCDVPPALALPDVHHGEVARSDFVHHVAPKTEKHIFSIPDRIFVTNSALPTVK